MAAAARSPKYMYKTAPGNSGELSIEYGTDLGALTRLEVSSELWAELEIWFDSRISTQIVSYHHHPAPTNKQTNMNANIGQGSPPPGRLGRRARVEAANWARKVRLDGSADATVRALGRCRGKQRVKVGDEQEARRRVGEAAKTTGRRSPRERGERAPFENQASSRRRRDAGSGGPIAEAEEQVSIVNLWRF